MFNSTMLCTQSKAAEDIAMEGLIELKQGAVHHDDNSIASCNFSSSSKSVAFETSTTSPCAQFTTVCTDSVMVQTKWVAGSTSECQDQEEMSMCFDSTSSSRLTAPSVTVSSSLTSTSMSISHCSTTPPLEITLELGEPESQFHLQPHAKNKHRGSSKAVARPSKSKTKLQELTYRPLGPRHLEYDYNRAHKLFSEATYVALGSFGYSAKGKGKARAEPNGPSRATAEIMVMMKNLPAVRRASARLDLADRMIEEALARGETWENTELPKDVRWENMNFSGLGEDEEWVRESLLWADAERPVVKTPNTRGKAKSLSGAVEDVRQTRSKTGALKPKCRSGEEAEARIQASPNKHLTNGSRGKKRKVDAIEDSEAGGAAEESVTLVSPVKSTPSPDRKRKTDAVDKENEAKVQVDKSDGREAKSSPKRRKVLSAKARA